tara:strand:+ start:970 stop:1497 length:528 start_codon:yes stop_codon:yes gene_type:complete
VFENKAKVVCYNKSMRYYFYDERPYMKLFRGLGYAYKNTNFCTRSQDFLQAFNYKEDCERYCQLVLDAMFEFFKLTEADKLRKQTENEVLGPHIFLLYLLPLHEAIAYKTSLDNHPTISFALHYFYGWDIDFGDPYYDAVSPNECELIKNIAEFVQSHPKYNFALKAPSEKLLPI